MLLSKYLAYDVEHIKRYIFSSRLLKTVVGGSLAVREFDDEISKLLKENQFNVIYASGGTGLAKAPENVDEDSVRQKILDLAKDYGLSVSVILKDVDSVKLEQPDFFDPAGNLGDIGKLFARIGFLMNKEKQKLRKSEIRSMNELKICKICGDHEATTSITTKDGNVDCCEICRKKYYLAQSSNASDNTYDISKIAEKPSDSEESTGYIAVIYADGNSLGTLFNRCKTIDEYKKLSQLIDDVVEKKTKELVERHTEYFARPVLGGDDILLFVPPSKALKILKDLHEEITNSLSGMKIDFSYALMVAPADLPFLISYDMVNQMLKNSKAQRNSGNGCFITFEYVDRIEQNRGSKDNKKTAVEMREFFGLLETVKSMKKAGFTKNHLKKFKTIIENSPFKLEREVAVSYFFIRAVEGNQSELLTKFINAIEEYSYQVFSDLFTYVSDFRLE